MLIKKSQRQFFDMNYIDIKISVIIPIFNDELYLHDALKSIQNQSFKNFECICVNDGSIDKSEEIIDEFVNNDSRFIKINRNNGGVSAARNSGLNVAKGQYIFMMDHDDLIPDYTLQKLLEAALEFNADMSRGRFMMIPEDFRLNQLPPSIQNSRPLYFQNPLLDFYKIARRKYKGWYYVWLCLFKKSIIENIKFLEDLCSGGEDSLFMFDVVSHIKDFVQINDIIACHRYSKTSITLNSYNSAIFIRISEINIPYIYHKYALDPNIDKRLLWWVYHKRSNSIYRYLIRNAIRKNNIEYQKKARDILLKFRGTPELKEVVNRWSFRQKIFYQLFIKEKYKLLRIFHIFI